MNPDQTPAHLPAPLPPTAALLHRTQGALGLLREVVQESSAEYWYERGKAASARQDWEEAVAAFRKCINLDKSHWRGTIQLAAAIAYSQASPDECFKIINRAYELNFTDWEIFVKELPIHYWSFFQEKFLTCRVTSNNEFDLAISISIFYWAQKADNTRLVLNSIKSKYSKYVESSAVWYRLSGSVWAHSNSIEKGVEDFNIAIELNPRNSHPYYERAKIKHFLCHYNQAITDYDYVTKLDPSFHPAYNNRGYSKYLNANHIGAIEDYDYAISLEPKKALYYSNRARAKFAIGDLAGAEYDWQYENHLASSR